MRFPLMLRRTHERELRRQVLELQTEEAKYQLREQEFERRADDLMEKIADVVRLVVLTGDVASFNASYFPAPAEAGIQKPAAQPADRPVMVALTGEEVVRRAEQHRRLGGRVR